MTLTRVVTIGFVAIASFAATAQPPAVWPTASWPAATPESQGLAAAPFDALVIVLSGALELTIGHQPVRAVPGTIVRMPANVPHAVDASEPSRMLLVMLRERRD